MNDPNLSNDQISRNKSDSPESKVEAQWHCQLYESQLSGRGQSLKRFTYRR